MGGWLDKKKSLQTEKGFSLKIINRERERERERGRLGKIDYGRVKVNQKDKVI